MPNEAEYYTPSMDEIKASATRLGAWAPDAFDRWLTAHDAKVQESILREASAGFRHCPDYPYRAARWRATEDYLDDMADRIARGEGDAHRPERCPTCGCDLAYPTAVHVVDCGEGSE